MKNVAVLRGGPSEEYHVSMQTGAAVLDSLKNSTYKTKDLVVTKKGEWLDSGFVKTPEAALEAVDVVFIALHGTYGEDGQVQKILQRNAIPFTGSRALSSGIAFNKDLTKQTLRPYGIKMPMHRRMHKDEMDRIDEEVSNIFFEIGEELFVKPLANGSSLGAKHIPNEQALKIALEDLFQTYDEVMIEQYIRGREATVGVLNNFRNENVYALPVIEIVPPKGEPLFSHENKYNGQTEEIVPGRFTFAEKDQLAEAARKVHEVIECDHYSRSDFIVKDGEVFFLEVNTLPGLTSESLFPKAAAAIGMEFNQLIEHLIENAHV